MSDFRDALRSLRATPIVTTVAILSLAIGIGANTAIFSIADSLLLKTLPVREPEQLVVLNRGSGRGLSSWTNPIWEQIRDRRTQLAADAFAYSITRFNLAPRGEADNVDGLYASGRFFEALGVEAMLGRTFGEADDRRGGGPDGPVAVISHAFWQRRYGGAADAIGRTITIERVPFTIIGITPPEFFGVDVGRSFDVAVPIGTEPLIRDRDSALDRRATWWLRIMLRLAPGQSFAAAEQALRGMQPQIREATIPEHYRSQDVARYLADPFTLVPAGSGVSGLRLLYQRPLAVLMVVVALVLLIACANIANLLLARAAARRHETSVRFALGAPRYRVARALFVESLVLACAGGALGLLVAQIASRLLVRQLSTHVFTVHLDLSLDWRMLAFTTGVAMATALLFGVAPALRASRTEPIEALREHGRGAAGDRRIGLGSLLVAGQVALSLVLVVAAALFVRTFAKLATLDAGFDTDPVLIVRTSAQQSAVAPDARPALYARVLEEVRAIPGVEHAAVSAVTPVSGATWDVAVEIEGAPERPASERGSFVHIVSSGWFATYGTALVVGRDFDEHDRRESPGVAIVNQAFVRKYLGTGNPIGRRVRHELADDEGGWLEIVGVVEDAVYRSFREPVPPTLYLALAQQKDAPTSMSVSVRVTNGPASSVARAVAEAIGRVDRELSLTFVPLRQQVDAALVQERIVAMLSGFFGALALLLAMLGLYGITSYAVSRRRAEIGIRLALGAAPAAIARMVLGRVGVLLASGIAVGGVVAWWAGRYVETLLFGLEARDLATLATCAIVLSAVGVLAGWLPARRAARIDPAVVLRAD
ncbi:MAG TPA: ABC transporter permease [Vicinamibacterales bacterium]